MSKDQKRSAPNSTVPAYGMGFMGALVYFIQDAESFLDGLWGVLLAFVWPAVLVYHALEKLAA